MKISSAEYLISAVSSDKYPNLNAPQFLLMGRSNVGKSSFINTLTERKNLAYTSSTPGKTQTLNFYYINKSWMLVDAPGYGYAKRSKETRVDYGTILENYLESRANVLSIILIIDALVGPTNDDLMVYEYLKQFSIPLVVVATKTDKVKKTVLKQTIDGYQKMFAPNKVFPFSSATKSGIDSLYEYFDQFLTK